MSCTATSDPTLPFEIKWKKEGIQMSNVSYSFETSSSVCVMANNCDEVRTISQLIISNVREEDAGVYTCAFNATQLGPAHQMNLQVEHRPYIRSKKPNETNWINMEAIVHSEAPIRVNLECSVVANPLASLTWFLGDAQDQIQLKNGLFRSSVGRMMVEIDSSKPNYSQLSLFLNASEINEQFLVEKEKAQVNFTLVAENQLGSSMETFQVKFGGHPFPPEILSIYFENGKLTPSHDENFASNCFLLLSGKWILILNESQVEKSQPKVAFYHLVVKIVPQRDFYLKKGKPPCSCHNLN